MIVAIGKRLLNTNHFTKAEIYEVGDILPHGVRSHYGHFEYRADEEGDMRYYATSLAIRVTLLSVKEGDNGSFSDAVTFAGEEAEDFLNILTDRRLREDGGLGSDTVVYASGSAVARFLDEDSEVEEEEEPEDHVDDGTVPPRGFMGAAIPRGGE